MNARLERLLLDLDAAAHRVDLAVRELAAAAEPYMAAGAAAVCQACVLAWRGLVTLGGKLRDWMGPVADSVKGRLNTEEVQRAMVKAVVGGGATSVVGCFKDPDVLGLVIVPAAVGVAFGLLDLGRRCRHGVDPTEAPPVT